MYDNLIILNVCWRRVCHQVERSVGVTWSVCPHLTRRLVMTPPGPRRPGLVSVRTVGAPVDTGEEESRTGGPGRVLSGAGAGAAALRDGRAER